MGKVALLLDDVTQLGTLVDAGTAPSVETGSHDWDRIGIQNLRVQDPTAVARFSGITGPTAFARMKWDFGGLKAVSCLAIINHNATTTGTFQLGLSNNADLSAPVYLSPLTKFWLPTVPWGSLPWGAFPWDGVDKGAYPTQPIAFLLLDTPLFARYLWVDVVDRTNPAGYWQAGRIMAGAAYRPDVNFAYGNAIQVVDNSPSRDTRANARQVDQRPRYRKLVLPMDLQTDTAALGVYHDFMMRGLGTEAFIVKDPDAAPWVLAREMFYCALDSMPSEGVGNSNHKRWTWSPTFRELI